METENLGNAPTHCPVCDGELLVTRLECASCGTDVNGRFVLGQLAGLREPHASLIEMFLRKRGNVKEMERELGLSYPTVRARLEEAFEAAGYAKEDSRVAGDTGAWEERFEADLAERIRARVEERLAGLNRTAARFEGQSQRRRKSAEEEARRAEERARILDRLDKGEIAADEAAALLRDLRGGTA